MVNRLYTGAQELERLSGGCGVRDDEKSWGTFRKDYARLLHAPSFRRLQGKTQLFPGGQSDFFRNRLTHSLEVAQIARGVAAALNDDAIPAAYGDGAKIDESLVEFAGIAHDLGHPPFGHNGEHALDELMLSSGGFEGNAQTLRILAAVERKLVERGGLVTADHGLDLTYRSLASVLKYDACIPVEREPRARLAKGYYYSELNLVSEIKRRVAPGLDVDEPFKTIECAIMDIADDIAYSTYDLEDSLHAGFYSPLGLFNEVINNKAVCSEVIRKTNQALFESKYKEVSSELELIDVLSATFDLVVSPNNSTGRDDKVPQKYVAMLDAVGRHNRDRELVENGLLRSRFTAERVGRLIHGVELVRNDKFPQLSRVRLGRSQLLQVEVLKHLNFEMVIRSPRLSVVEHRGKDIVKGIFEAVLNSKGELLPEDWRERYFSANRAGAGGVRRVICDFIACMTDRYAFELYGRLFGEDSTIFKPF